MKTITNPHTSHQGRLSNIIGPGQGSALWSIPTQPLTGIKLSINLNIYLLYWYFQQNQCINMPYRLAWCSCASGAPGQLLGVPMCCDITIKEQEENCEHKTNIYILTFCRHLYH